MKVVDHMEQMAINNIIERAEELGIDTEGKSKRELLVALAVKDYDRKVESSHSTWF